MKPEDAIRRLRNADRWNQAEPGFLPPASNFADTVLLTPHPHSNRVRVAVVTIVVLLLVVAGSTALIRSTHPEAPAAPAPSPSTHALTPTPTPSRSSSAGTVGALPRIAGQVLATWTTQHHSPASRTLDAHGKAIAITLTCTGGGSVQYTVVGRSDSSQGCDGITTGGPQLSSKNGALIPEHEVIVHVSTTGHPRYALRVTAVDVTTVPPTGADATPTVNATGPSVPATLRSCGRNDLVPVTTYARWPHFQGGLLTITSSSSTDCALRTWPTLRYLDERGAPIGGPAQRDQDSASPVRLTAHGTAYIQIELFTLDRLNNCGAKQVKSLLLTIDHATTRVSIPPDPAVGKCVDTHTTADGVGPATSTRPASP